MSYKKPLLKLVPPNIQHGEAFIQALRDGFVIGVRAPYTDQEITATCKDLAGHIDRIINPTGKVQLPDGSWGDRVPALTFWLIEEQTFIGSINLRLGLNDFLATYGGHVGYGISPPFQKQGYGTAMLRLLLPIAKAEGLERLLITCSDQNIGSRKIIENCGGVLTETLPDNPFEKGASMLQFWITL